MKRVLNSSVSTEWKTCAKGWAQFIDQLEADTGIQIDSAYKRQPDNFITGYRYGNEYDIEVTKYSDGTYEALYDNIYMK